MLFITIMTKCLIQRKRSTKYDKKLSEAEQGATGTSTGDERLEVLVVLKALSELPRVGRNWAAVAYLQEEKEVE